MDLTNLGSYVSNGSGYALQAVKGSPTVDALIKSKNAQFGVKGTAAILKIGGDVTLVDGSACGRSGASNVALSNATITTYQIKDEANVCPSALHGTFFADSIAKGQTPTEDLLPAFADAIMSDRASKIAAAVEDLAWRGDTTLTGSTNLKRANGFLKLATSATTVAATGSTNVEKLQHVYKTADATVRNDASYKIFVGQDTYDNYLIDLAGKNIYKPTDDMKLFGTNATLFVSKGLNGTGKVVGARMDNLHFAADAVEDMKGTLKYSVETDQWYQDFKFGVGFGIAYNTSSEVVIGTGF